MADGMIRRDVPWREKTSAMKVLAVLLLASWLAFVVSMLVAGGIETVALKQPENPTPIYSHAHQIKCGIRYFTDTQEGLYSLAKPTMITGFALFVLFGAAYEMLRRADYNRRKSVFFHRVGA
jgi:hypothetical protein